MEKWTRARVQPSLPLTAAGRVTASDAHIALSRKAAGEGMVLLKNDGVLPLRAGTRAALFGKGSFDYVKGGGGSGDVTVAYVRNLYDGLKMQGDVAVYEPLADYYRAYVAAQYAGGAVPGMMAEPPLPEDLADGARAFADTAIVVISRFSGEGWDRSGIEYDAEYNPWETETSMPKIAGKIFPDGDFYLTAQERAMLEAVKVRFDRVVAVLNIGGVMDTAWIKNDAAIGAALIGGQGGMEGGAAMADVLTGRVNPSGKLVDTFAADIADYPSTKNFHESVAYVNYTEDIYVGYRYFETLPGAKAAVVYPFGYGLSYTAFDVRTVRVSEAAGTVTARVDVTNIGSCEGCEVVQLYVCAPQGKLQKPARELRAFAKTRLLKVGETQTLLLRVPVSELASYDDLGKVQKSAWVLEAGDYAFYIGTSVRDAERADFVYRVAEDTVVSQLSAHLVPTCLPERLLADGTLESLPQGANNDMNACAFEKMLPGTEEALAPAERARPRRLLMAQHKGRVLAEVAAGRMTLSDFMAQLSDEELIGLLGGQPNTGVANTFGFGNLPEYGVPNIMTADGPAGLRIAPECGVVTTAWPCATMIACTWDTALAEAVGRAGAQEVKENNIGVWLTPAINIHRNPLCGRNFEYYSEDPLIAGKMGAAMVRGIQSEHVGAAVKHFAVNNKETNRKNSDSRVSERALREIYLRTFERIVKEADPWVIMSAYNVVNGWRASECRELLEDVLRGEWGFQGMVTTDWWTRGEHYKEIKAGNDVKMATGFPERVQQAMALGELTRADLLRCAERVLGLILKVE